jgi:hypothetical protein
MLDVGRSDNVPDVSKSLDPQRRLSSFRLTECDEMKRLWDWDLRASMNLIGEVGKRRSRSSGRENMSDGSFLHAPPDRNRDV